MVINLVMRKMKYFMICWEIVFRYEIVLNIFLIRNENVIFLYSEENVFND